MTKKLELLAPGGDLDCIKAAIAAGADAIYCGLDKFNARNRAENILFQELTGVLRLAHANDCKVFLTLNTIIVESEIPFLIRLLNKLVNTRIDGVIVQDLGMFYLISKYFKGLEIHASTQLTTHNEGQIGFLSKLNASRVNLSRELSVDEIKHLAAVGHKDNILTEIFVHGSNCLSFSGICYISSVHGGNSGNRGRCSQPCRDQYETTVQGKKFPLNLKDNSAFFDLLEIADAGVDSIKIEGRIKKYHYVYTVVDAWRKQLERYYHHNTLSRDNSALHTVFNRDFSNAFLKGDINKSMFIDNPRDNSAIHQAEKNGGVTDENIKQAKRTLYDRKTEIIKNVKKEITRLVIEKAPVIISVSGEVGAPLKVSVTTPESTFVVLSEMNLVNIDENSLSSACSERQRDKGTKERSIDGGTIKRRGKGSNCLNHENIYKRFKTINDTEYSIEHLGLEDLHPGLFIPFKELTRIKKRILFLLNGSKEFVDPVEVPPLKKQGQVGKENTLSLLISSEKELYLCDQTPGDIYFQLPNCLKDEYQKYIDLFLGNERIIPWFPSVIIGDNYSAAVEFLHQVQPKSIVTNNTGIAYEAAEKGIPWIAGPYLNIVNSYSLLCLKENFKCSGAFISNEISRTQIKKIRVPGDFKLYYSIYHPLLLLSSRQCLFHQVIGCEKQRITGKCMQECSKNSSITNLKNDTFLIEKSEKNYHSIYNNLNYLNVDVVTDLPGFFTSFFVDLRGIETATGIGGDKAQIITLFENHLNGDLHSKEGITQVIYPTTDVQYSKGI